MIPAAATTPQTPVLANSSASSSTMTLNKAMINSNTKAMTKRIPPTVFIILVFLIFHRQNNKLILSQNVIKMSIMYFFSLFLV